ncbi:MAG TPA: response regulator transcription factor [Nocardioides sp.]|uniref:response regulator transcription factor n=1 Tax=uncultured Nocardioides sp. TaxID=198441 RepID=UPI00260398B8|nr:response regulator transcription factor [uncultured Nocardioides sp.]HRI94641.1 response regulator transcription factor [Nocardioides sp.]HRK44040.1 response regulator transcription factor [Nocardioides sp.]
MSISIVVIDDHPIVEEGVRNLVSADGDLTFAGAAQTLRAGLRMVQSCRPDVILLDVRLGETGATTAVHALRSIHPSAAIILFTAHPRSADAARAIRAGACSAIPKETPPRRIRELVKAVVSGSVVSGRGLPALIHGSDRHSLTPRQLEVLEMVAAGMTNREIAEELHLRPTTVKAYWQESMQRLGVRNRAEAIAFAYSQGLL